MPTDPIYNPSIPLSSMSSSPTSSSWASSPASDTSHSWSAIAAGLCAGGFVGAAAALMLAPMRGSEFRSSIRSYASQGGDRLSNLIESGRCLAEDALHQLTSAIEQGRQALRTSSTSDSSASSSYSSSQPLTASLSDMSSGVGRRFEEPLGG